MYLPTLDPLTAIGIFVLGASAGSLLRYIQDRAVINHYEQEHERANLLSNIGESLLTDIHEHGIAASDQQDPR